MLRSWLLTIGLILATATPADAAMMKNFDLSGLVMGSTAIVVADHVGVAPTAGLERFHVTKVLRGAVAGDVEIDVSLYDYSARAAPRVVLFLEGSSGAWRVVSSGLRLIVEQRAVRFVQQRNPGGFTAVPQGSDPDDQWLGGRPALDEAGLMKAIAAAITRVDALAAASQLRDPVKRRAALFALLPREGASRAVSFYDDRVTATIERVLADAGDLEGALLAEGHDHTTDGLRDRYGAPGPLLAWAVDPAHPAATRVTALRVLGRSFESLDDVATGAVAMGAVVRGLFADAEPTVRVAAITLAARAAALISTDPAARRRAAKLTKAARAVAKQRWSVETDQDVLYAIATEFGEPFRAALPARKAIPAVLTHVAIGSDFVFVEAVCTRPGAPNGTATLVSPVAGVAAARFDYNVSYRCGKRGFGESGGGPIATVAPGRYPLVLTLTFGKRVTTLAVGTLVREASGESQLEP